MSFVTGEVNNGTLTIHVNGRVDSTNSSEFGKLCEELRNNPHDTVVFNFENLQYISSAGLRVLISTRKKEKNLSVVNANSSVFEVLEMTGMTEILNVKKAMRTIDVTGCKVIGEGVKSVIYQIDGDNIVKAYKSGNQIEAIEKERRLARQAFIWGVPTAISFDIVKIGDSYGAVYELIDAKSMSLVISENPERIDECVKTFTNVLKDLHSVKVEDGIIPNVKQNVKVWIKDSESQFGEDVIAKLYKLVEDCNDTNTLLHFDYQTNNVLLQGDEAMLIDMDTMCSGNPVFELGNTHFSYQGFGATNPQLIEKFFGFSKSTADEFWRKFLRLYLETEDENKLSEAMNKVELLSYLRVVRHYARRPHDDELSTRALEYSKDRVNDLIKKVDSLELS